MTRSAGNARRWQDQNSADVISRRNYASLRHALEAIRKSEGKNCRKAKKQALDYAERLGWSVHRKHKYMQWWIEMIADPEYVPNAADEVIARFAEMIRVR